MDIQVRVWRQSSSADGKPTLHKEQLEFEYVHPSTRSYK